MVCDGEFVDSVCSAGKNHMWLELTNFAGKTIDIYSYKLVGGN